MNEIEERLARRLEREIRICPNCAYFVDDPPHKEIRLRIKDLKTPEIRYCNYLGMKIRTQISCNYFKERK